MAISVKIDGNQLIDWARLRLQAKSDRQLSMILGVYPPAISKIRTGKTLLGKSLLVKILDQTGVKVNDLPCLLSEFRPEAIVRLNSGRKRLHRG